MTDCCVTLEMQHCQAGIAKEVDLTFDGADVIASAREAIAKNMQAMSR